MELQSRNHFFLFFLLYFLNANVTPITYQHK